MVPPLLLDFYCHLPGTIHDFCECLVSLATLGSPRGWETEDFQVFNPSCLGCYLVIGWINKDISEPVLVGTGNRTLPPKLQIKLTINPKLTWECPFEARVEGNANKYIQRKADQKEKSLAQESNPGDQMDRYEGDDSVETPVFVFCLVTGEVNRSWKKHHRVGPKES